MSIGLVAALVGLTSLTLVLLLVPLLLRRGAPAARDAYNLAVYRDQLAEVERDLARGVLGAEQAEAARAEIGRRILALGPASGQTAPDPRPLAAAVVAILLLPVAALLIYGQLGSPALPDAPFAARTAAATEPAADNPAHLDMTAAVAKLRAQLKEHPDDLTGWLLLARSELSRGHYQEGADAYRRAADLSGHRADVVGDWGEAQVLAAGGTVTPAARQAFKTALDDPQTAPRSRYYLALAQMQHGDVKDALKAWRALAADSPADAAWQPLLRQRIAEATAKLGLAAPPASATNPTAANPTAANPTAGNGGMPSAAAVAAAEQATAGSPDAQRAMINAMVARLAARLEQQPNDVEGWTRLGRSYMVLNEPAKARQAYARAVKLKPDDPALQQALAAATLAAAKTPAQPSR